MDNHIDREKLAKALQQVRRDIAKFQRDVGYAERNRTNWIFLIMTVVVANFLRGWWSLDGLSSLGWSVALVVSYRFVDGVRIWYRAHQSLKEPVEPMWDTTVEL